MAGIIRKLIKTTWGLICIIAVIVLAGTAVMMFAHIRPAVVVSGSMEPVIHTGSMVFIDKEYEKAKERDIIAFEKGGMTVTHRVVKVTDEGYVTKGDANESEDPGILPESALRGRVAMWLPWIGYGVRAIGSPAGITAAVAVFIALATLYRLTGKEVGQHDGKKNTDCSDSPAA